MNLDGLPLAVDKAGLPTLLRAGKDSPKLPGATATAIAKAHLARLAPSWGVRADALPTLEVLGEVKLKGMTIVRLRQLIDGIPVDRESGGELHVAVRGDGSFIAANGRLFSATMPRAAARFKDTSAGAVARAVGNLYKTQLPASAFAAQRSFAATGGGSELISGKAGDVSVSRARAQQVWYAAPGAKSLTPAWVVESYSSTTGTDGEATRTVLGADGKELRRDNLKADVAFRYRVFAETTGEFHPFDGPIVDSTPNPTGRPSPLLYPNTPYPAFATPNLVTVDGTNHPDGGDVPDPWMDDPTFTETKGNNVDAYADFNDPDGLTFGDFRATTTSTRTFDRTYDTSKPAQVNQGQRMAGVTSLFYIVNWMHDFWYDGGFTEAAGNAQESNLGRGGIPRDALLVEAQDASGRNNANMATPGDGFPPRMQVYIWDNKDLARELKLGARNPLTATASFAPPAFNVTAATIIADDNVATKTDACTALPAAVAGKIVIVDRGACSFKLKALNVQTAGGVGMILANNAPTEFPLGLADDDTIEDQITIAVLSVTQAEGVALKALAGGNATLHREPGADLDGSLDASVIGHEFGHYVHHRLSVCNTTLCGAMSEGWADFSALLLITREGDNLDAAFPMGIYSTRSFLADPAYYGIRRAPYSTNPAINGWTYKNMQTGEPIPTTFPTTGASPGSNAEVHNGGEVWASMLWDGYVALQKARGDQSFDDVRLKMRQYAVAGLLLAPPNGTPTEIRDAILAAVYAMSPDDHDVLAAAYAKRGFGSCAVSPDAFSTDFVGIVDSMDVKARIATGTAQLIPQGACDADSVLDGGEGAQIKVVVTNPGPAAAENVVATLHTALPGIHVTPASIPIGKMEPYSRANAVFQIKLDDSFTAPTASDMTVDVSSDGSCGPAGTAIDIRLNTDDKAQASATDSFDAGTTAWEASHDEALSGDGELWTHQRKSALDGFFVGENFDGPSDASLTSPPLKGTTHVTLKFQHEFVFEFSGDPEGDYTAFDGGVIEYTVDGGKTWSDISDLADPGYNSTLDGDPESTLNPLAGRDAYGAVSAGLLGDTPTADTVSLDFGNQLDGKTFQIRFRVGSDINTGAPGWAIDNVAFTGIEGTPFPTLVADAGSCAAPDDSSDNGGCSASGHGLGAANAGAGLLVLGVLLRRRRRK
jgi:uncharacterized protein (TIGR03382 family)